MKIQVLGTGCARCGLLAHAVEDAVRRTGASAAVEKVTDLGAILAMAPPALPALAVDGRVVAAGAVPTAAELDRLLSQGATP